MTRRAVSYTLRASELADLLHLPEHHYISTISVHPGTLDCFVVVHGDDLPEVRRYCEPEPATRPGFTRYTITGPDGLEYHRDVWDDEDTSLIVIDQSAPERGWLPYVTWLQEIGVRGHHTVQVIVDPARMVATVKNIVVDEHGEPLMLEDETDFIYRIERIRIETLPPRRSAS